MAEFDLAVIGGGINGTGIAREAAGRGLRVVLFEQGDLACGTSSASSKLVHGGLRYLEQGQLRLVRTALREREVLLRSAPHLIRPLRFVLPLGPAGRSPLLLRLGLALYDRLGRRRILPSTRTLDLAADAAGGPLRDGFRKAYEYSDCLVDDARLVVLNAVDAAERGALIRTRTRCTRAARGDLWRLAVETAGAGEQVTARALVNAAGAWVERVAEKVLRQQPGGRLRLVQGSHIVVRALYAHDRAYILQAADGRVVFAVPFERDFTLIGTTDRAVSGAGAAAAPTAAEIEYLCTIVNAYFRASIGAADVVWAFAGVRALHDDGARKPQDVGREYALALDERAGEAPLLTVYGGKLTTYRRLAEDALDRLAHLFPPARRWSGQSPLPGGDFPHDGLEDLTAQVLRRWPFLAPAHAGRLVRAYGTRVARVLGDARGPDDLGARLGADLTAAELRYLMANEWAQSADDVLWRRSKLGLRFSPPELEALARFMAQARAARGARAIGPVPTP